MKLKKWGIVLSSMCAMLTMQMHVSAMETQADTKALKTALIEYEWEIYTQPKTRAKGIENSADLVWVYTSLDEFFAYYNQNKDGLSRIDVNSDYSVRHFYDDWTDFLDEWVAEKEELYGEISIVDAGDTFQLVDEAGNAVESFYKLYQFTYLNDEMSKEDSVIFKIYFWVGILIVAFLGMMAIEMCYMKK